MLFRSIAAIDLDITATGTATLCPDGAACAAGNAGLIQGSQMLRLGECDLALAGGVSESIHTFGIFASFKRQGALASHEDPTRASRPFDAGYLEHDPIALVRVATDLSDTAVNGEWIGLAKLTARGSERVRAELDAMATDGSLATAGLPDLFTRLANGGDPPRVVYVTGHWMDVDDAFDLARAGDFL